MEKSRQNQTRRWSRGRNPRVSLLWGGKSSKKTEISGKKRLKKPPRSAAGPAPKPRYSLEKKKKGGKGWKREIKWRKNSKFGEIPKPGIAPGIGASIPKGKIRVWKPQKRPGGSAGTILLIIN